MFTSANWPRLWTIGGVLLVCVLYDQYRVDLIVQDYFWDSARLRWALEDAPKVLEILLYSGAKAAIICLALAFLVYILANRKELIREGRFAAFSLAFVSMALIPTTIAILKAETDVACPKALVRYDGELDYRRLLPNPFATAHAGRRQRCFPAGHASAGFSLLGLSLIATRRRRALWLTAIALGWVMGLYKMAIGDHFLSHTVASMVIAIGITSGAKRLERYWTLRSRPDLLRSRTVLE